MMRVADRLLGAVAGAAGLSGVALSAAAVHSGAGASLETAARFLMFHAPALLALAAMTASGLVRASIGHAAGCLLALGLGLFSGDLACRALAGIPLFPMAAPAGGLLLIAGWAAIAVAALVPARQVG